MPHQASDGQQFTNRMAMNNHNASLRGMGKDQPAQSDADAGKDIHDDPEALKLVDQLKQMGYTGEDVKQCMDEGGDSSEEQGEQSAPLSIPGAR